MDISISSPALIFPSISFLLIAYTNRFLAIASLIRHLKTKYSEDKSIILLLQIKNLRKRLTLIRYMQGIAIIGMILALLSICAILFHFKTTGHVVFVLAILAVMASLITGVFEIFFSGRALDLELKDIEEDIYSKNK